MNLEEIRQKKLKELQEKMMQQQQEEDIQEQHLQQQLQQVEAIAKKYLSKEALQRYNNLKLVHQEKAIHAATIIAQAVSVGQLTRKISDKEFKEVLVALDKGKREFKIKR